MSIGRFADTLWLCVRNCSHYRYAKAASVCVRLALFCLRATNSCLAREARENLAFSSSAWISTHCEPLAVELWPAGRPKVLTHASLSAFVRGVAQIKKLAQLPREPTISRSSSMLSTELCSVRSWHDTALSLQSQEPKSPRRIRSLIARAAEAAKPPPAKPSSEEARKFV